MSIIQVYVIRYLLGHRCEYTTGTRMWSRGLLGLETHPSSTISVVYERKRCLNWFVARYTGFEKSACRGFFSNVSGMNSQEDSVSAVSPGLLVSLVDVYKCKQCLNWICSV